MPHQMLSWHDNKDCHVSWISANSANGGHIVFIKQSHIKSARFQLTSISFNKTVHFSSRINNPHKQANIVGASVADPVCSSHPHRLADMHY